MSLVFSLCFFPLSHNRGWTDSRCDISWRHYGVALDAMRYTLTSISCVLAIVSLWRLIVIIRWRIHRHHERRLLAFLNHTAADVAITNKDNINRPVTTPIATTTTTASPIGSARVPMSALTRSSNACELIRLCIDSQTLMFVCLFCTNFITALDSMDPVLSEGIWTYFELSYVIRIINIPISLDAVVLWVRFYLLIHAKWHTPTRRIIIWFDRYMIGINIAAFAGLLLGVVDDGKLTLAFYLVLIFVTIIFLQLGSVLWAQTTLRSLIRRLEATLATSISAPTIATSSSLSPLTTSSIILRSSIVSPPSPLPVPSSPWHQNAQSRPLLSASSQTPPLPSPVAMYYQPRFSSSTPTIPLPSSTLALPLSLTTVPATSTTSRGGGGGGAPSNVAWAAAANNQSAYIAAKQMLSVLRWCQLFSSAIIILIVWHNLYNLGYDKPIPAMIYLWLLRIVTGISMACGIWYVHKNKINNVLVNGCSGCLCLVVWTHRSLGRVSSTPISVGSNPNPSSSPRRHNPHQHSIGLGGVVEVKVAPAPAN
jgi:hypothetical protein